MLSILLPRIVPIKQDYEVRMSSTLSNNDLLQLDHEVEAAIDIITTFQKIDGIQLQVVSRDTVLKLAKYVDPSRT